MFHHAGFPAAANSPPTNSTGYWAPNSCALPTQDGRDLLDLAVALKSGKAKPERIVEAFLPTCSTWEQNNADKFSVESRCQTSRPAVHRRHRASTCVGFCVGYRSGRECQCPSVVAASRLEQRRLRTKHVCTFDIQSCKAWQLRYEFVYVCTLDGHCVADFAQWSSTT